MNKTLPLLLFALIGVHPLLAQTRLYVHPNAETYVSNTKVIAILPFKTEILLRPKRLKQTTPEQLNEMEQDQGLNIQKSMYSWLLNKRKQDKLLVDLQSPKKTNALLKEADIDIHATHDLLASKLCEILGVEAVVSGTFESNQPISTGAAIGLSILGGSAVTQNATLNLDITHKDDEIVVNYLKNLKGGLSSSTDDLVNVLMRKTARRIPYTKTPGQD